MSAKKKPDFAIHQRQKWIMQGQVIATLLLVGLLFFFFVVPKELLDQIFGDVGQLWRVAIRFGAASSVAPTLAFVLFATDSATRGNSRAAKWVRGLYPSRAAALKFSCNRSEASELWFKYFDTWSLPRSPHQILLRNSYAATYGARMVFYLERACLLFAALTVMAMFTNHVVLQVYDGKSGAKILIVHVSVFVLCLLIWAFLRATNRIAGKDKEPTGAWHRVAEILGRSQAAFEREILSGSSSLDECHEKIALLQQKWNTPFSEAAPEQKATDKSLSQ